MNNESDDYRSVPLDDYVKLSQSYWDLDKVSRRMEKTIAELRAQVLVMETREQDLASEVERLQDLNRELCLAKGARMGEQYSPPGMTSFTKKGHDYDGW